MRTPRGEDTPLVPEQTTDDHDVGWGDHPDDRDEGDNDRRLRENRPPHWDSESWDR
jgi:hypothetical protein